MANKHTPGPWMRFNGSIYKARQDGGKFYAEMAIAGVFAKEDEKLIAAAPDLLAALQKFAEYEKHMDEDDHVSGMLAYAELQDMAKAAIAKATGD